MLHASLRLRWTVVLWLLVLAIWLSITFPYQNLVAQFSRHRSSQAQKAFTVDGLSGTILPVIAKSNLVFYPGDVVTVTINRANLFFYSYEVVLNSQKKLGQSYNVVGVGELIDSKGNQVAQTFRPGQLPGAMRTEPSVSQMQAIRSAFDTIAKLRDQLKQRQDSLMNFYEEPSRLFEGNTSWSEGLNHEVTQWPHTSRDIRCTFRNVSRKLDSLYTDCLFPTLPKVDSRRSMDQTDQKRGEDKKGNKPPATEQTRTDASANPGVDLLTLIDTAIANLNQLADEFNSVEAVLMRWSKILAENKSPVLTHSFRIDDDSRRYTVEVKRFPLYDPHLSDVGQGAGAHHDTTLLASIPFEGHEKSRFNLSVGFAVLYRPDSYSYGLVGIPASDTSLMYKTQKTGNSQTVLKPLVLLSIYFTPIDVFDQRRSTFDCRNWMFTIGTELNLPINTFVIGIGYDIPFGLVLSGGLTVYSKTVPADGWPEGQLVSSKNYTTVGTLPTKSESALGYYLSVSFRPAIFDAFYGLLKKNP